MKALALVLGMALALAPPTEAVAHDGRKPPSKPQPKRKNPPPHKKMGKKQVASAETAEEELHSERLAILGRLKEVNDSVRDAELAAAIRRLDELEGKRHGLSLKLLARAREQDKEEAPK